MCDRDLNIRVNEFVIDCICSHPIAELEGVTNKISLCIDIAGSQ